MLGRMDTLSYLMVVFCFTFFIGEGEALPSSCDITLKVKRGTTLEATKGQSLTVSCPVGHCGESLNVTWCKLLGKSNCEVVSSTKKVEINQEHVNDELISYLRFKEVSINDGGQYRCNLIRQSSQLVSHSINISVSGTNKEVQNSVTSTGINNEVQKSVNSTVESVGDGDDTSHRWQVFVSVSVSFASVVVILTIIDPLNSHGPKTDTKRADGLVESRATYALITHRHPIISAKLQKMTQDDKNSLCTTVIYSKQFYYPT
ncbi:B- and T-lymphocyte attenuator isoform X5 [Kryptolebias marmoratus]|uniref:B- and T-lymphocyte attenuator isoform X5 n=1 Tax=Kryptolebias marmoratus TaxID=37003 RepID=UPI0018ACE09C|nr:B- and T-lymphocyte attenuator isoform X5 [Kryptolebias marmoratus]